MKNAHEIAILSTLSHPHVTQVGWGGGGGGGGCPLSRFLVHLLYSLSLELQSRRFLASTSRLTFLGGPPSFPPGLPLPHRRDGGEPQRLLHATGPPDGPGQPRIQVHAIHDGQALPHRGEDGRMRAGKAWFNTALLVRADSNKEGGDHLIMFTPHHVHRSSCSHLIMFTPHHVHTSSCSQVIMFTPHHVHRSSYSHHVRTASTLSLR